MSIKAWVSGAIILGGAVFAYLGGTFSTPVYLEMRASEQATRDSLTALKHEFDSLRLFRDSLANFPSVRERYAREYFGMLRPGELGFKIVPDSSGRDSTSH